MAGLKIKIKKIRINKRDMHSNDVFPLHSFYLRRVAVKIMKTQLEQWKNLRPNCPPRRRPESSNVILSRYVTGTEEHGNRA